MWYTFGHHETHVTRLRSSVRIVIEDRQEWRDGSSESDVTHGLTPGSRDLGLRGWPVWGWQLSFTGFSQLRNSST